MGGRRRVWVLFVGPHQPFLNDVADVLPILGEDDGGGRAQARHGFAEQWEERLGRAGLVDVWRARPGVNCRTQSEVIVEAEPVILDAIPEANVPR